jgi:porin
MKDRWSPGTSCRVLGLFCCATLIYGVGGIARAGTDENIDHQLDRQPIREAATWLETEVVDPALAPVLDAQMYLKEELNIDLGVSWTVIFQAATGDRADDELAVSNFDFFGRWRLLEGGTLGFKLRDRRNFNDGNSAKFAAGTGSIWRTNDSLVTDDFTALIQLWWQHRFFEERLVLTLGKIDFSAYFNQNRFADSDDRMFMSQPLSTNPVRRFPGNGLGIALTVSPSDEFYLAIGAGDANGDAQTSGFNTIDESEFFKVIEFGWTPESERWGKGNYRFTVNHSDETDSADDHVAFSFSADQDLGEQWGWFARYSNNTGDVTVIEQLLAGGVVFRGPFGLEHDAVGLGVSWADPSDGSRRDQTGIEVFYRAQVAPSVQVSPGVQLIFNPADNNDDDPVAVFTLRSNVSF